MIIGLYGVINLILPQSHKNVSYLNYARLLRK